MSTETGAQSIQDLRHCWKEGRTGLCLGVRLARTPDIAQIVIDLLEMDPRALPSKVELRPSRPPKKG